MIMAADLTTNQTLQVLGKCILDSILHKYPHHYQTFEPNERYYATWIISQGCLIGTGDRMSNKCISQQ